MMITPQEKTYQKIENMFSTSQINDAQSSLPVLDYETNEIQDSLVTVPSSAVKKSIEIECRGKKYVYHLGEVLRRKWAVWDVLHGEEDSLLPESEMEENPITGGKSRVFWGGAIDDVESTQIESTEDAFRLRFCLFSINTQAIIPFLEYWLVTDPQDDKRLSFPEASFVPSSDMNVETESEEEHAEFLDVCRGKFMEMGIIKEEQEETLNTERLEQGYHGYLVSGKEPRTVYVFYQLDMPPGVSGSKVIIDEIVNLQKSGNTPIDQSICTLFYEHPEVLYIYGSPVNPIDSLVYGKSSNYDENDEAAQEIPYCLYLCQDKKKYSEEAQEGLAVETITGMVLGLEEKHFISPDDKYEISTAKNEVKRCEDAHGYFYYFTHEQIGERKEHQQRYAVFVYNTDYRLDNATMKLLESLDLEKRLVGGDHWQWNFIGEDWNQRGGGFIEKQSMNSPSREKYAENVDAENVDAEVVPEETTETEEEEKNAAVYASVYFQRDGYALWCIKHRMCFTALDR